MAVQQNVPVNNVARNLTALPQFYQSHQAAALMADQGERIRSILYQVCDLIFVGFCFELVLIMIAFLATSTASGRVATPSATAATATAAAAATTTASSTERLIRSSIVNYTVCFFRLSDIFHLHFLSSFFLSLHIVSAYWVLRRLCSTPGIP